MKILDVCCGGKMFWFDKENPLVEFCDIKNEDIELHGGRIHKVRPDITCDFRNLPHESNSFDMVVFDPPHFKHTKGKKGILIDQYGKLDEDWEIQITEGFSECFQ